MKTIIIALALAAPLTFASVSTAAPAKSTTPGKASVCARAKARGKACNLTFRVHDVKGDRATGDGSSIRARLQTRFGTLIRVRTHFNDRIFKNAEGVK